MINNNNHTAHDYVDSIPNCCMKFDCDAINIFNIIEKQKFAQKLETLSTSRSESEQKVLTK